MSIIKPSNEEKEELYNRFAPELIPPFSSVVYDAVLYGVLPTQNETFDVVIFSDNKPYAAIEYKSSAYSINLDYRFDWLTQGFRNAGLKFGIYYFGKDDEFYLYKKGKYRFTKMSFKGVISALKSGMSVGEKPLVDDVATEILSCMPDDLSVEMPTVVLHELNELFTEVNLCFDETLGVVSFTEEIEDRFFRLLLPQNSPDSLCRYSSLNSLFLTLRDKRQCMCSLTCMNDKGEISYADKYLHYGVYALSDRSIEENNDCFILSCCDNDKSDDLTMWRLYGDHGKGVCLQYEVREQSVDNSQFFMASVSYGESKERHLELDFIRGIEEWIKDGWRFKLKRWYIWKHFFKSYLFKDEHEIRLLFLPTEDSKVNLNWILDSTNSIVSRIALFDVVDDTFPLALKSAIVGPKCPEQYSNMQQLNFMNKKQNVLPQKGTLRAIKTSVIKDYR